MTLHGNGQLQLNFNEKLDDPASTRSFQMDLSTDVVFAVMTLLGNALEQSHWGIGQQPPEVVFAEEDASVGEIGLSPDATQPTYLN